MRTIPDEKIPLRAEAEARLAKAAPPQVPGRSDKELLHELQVYQIELEMQNEELRRMQVDLEESRDRYADLYELAPVGYLTLTDTSLIAGINLTGAALLGEERQRLVQRRFAGFVAAGDSDRWHRFFLGVLQHDDRQSCELDMQRGDGSSFSALLDCIRTGKAGEAQRVRIILNDISKRKQDEQAIRKSEERLRAIFDQVIVGIVQSDLAGNITYANNRYCEITGYRRDELLGKQWRDLTYQEDLQNSTRNYEQMIRENTPFSFEKRYVFKNGRICWVAISASPLCDPDGHIVGGLAAVVDISARKQAEELLEKSSAEIADLYNHAPCGYHSIDKDGIIRQINDTELKWLGYTRDEVIGKMKATDLLTPASQQIFRESYTRFMKQGIVHDLEFEMIRRDGTVFTALVNATAIYSPGGDYVMSRSTITDLSRHKRGLEALRASVEKYRVLYENSRDALMTVAPPSWKYTSANRSTLMMFGASSEAEFTRLGPWDISPELQPDGQSSAEKARQMIATAMRDGSIFFEWTHKRLDGSTFPADVLLSRIKGEGQEYIQAAMRDITERKRLEKEIMERREKMAELQKLQIAAQTAAAIAHELNQPLMAIASYSNATRILLQAEKPDLDEIRNTIAASERQVLRAGDSIHDLLEFLSMKEFPSEAFDLNQEILGVLDTARPDHELQFQSVVRLEQGLPLVRANRTHIQKVLLNLLHNGIEAMQEAGVPLPSITVAVHTIKGSGLAQVTIQDNGPGIKNEDSRRMFEPFFTTKAEGIGMGLSISRSLIEANGGQLWIDPQERPGATFHFTLPLAT